MNRNPWAIPALWLNAIPRELQRWEEWRASLPAHCSHGRPPGHRPPPMWRPRESDPKPSPLACWERTAIDFDGVIHDSRDHLFRHPCHIDGPPMVGAFDLLRHLLRQGGVVWLHTARLCADIDPRDTDVPELPIGVRVEALREWFRRHGGQDITQHDGWRWWTGRGKPPASRYIDDHAVLLLGEVPHMVHLHALDAEHREERQADASRIAAVRALLDRMQGRAEA